MPEVHESVRAGRVIMYEWSCPECDTFAMFDCGPTALGVSVNLTFRCCGARYNFCPGTQSAERID